ncbi:hypothetical protein AAE021_16790 [Arthrobacter citreus]|jgi:hypothetical protein|uniref:Uncharacterized protein n=1 Tax=Arthrobacter citreus TaxID=1670 RepID=A0ABZ2ZWK1_9MICC
MGFDAVEPEQRRRLREALSQAGIETSQLWMKYFSIGGEAGEYEVDAYLNGSFSLPPLQRDILAHAANELIDDLPPRLRAPYCDDDDLGSRNNNREQGSNAPRDRHGPSGEESRRPRRDAGPDQE